MGFTANEENTVVELLCKQRDQLSEDDASFLLYWLAQASPSDHQRLFSIANERDLRRADR